MKSWIAVTVVLALVATGVYLLIFLPESSAERQYVFAPVTRGDLETEVSSTGTLSAVGTVQIGAQVSADIEKILVDFNDEVKKGQVLAIFDTKLLKADVQKAEAEENQSRVKLEQAEAEFKRNQPLFEKGFLSETEFLTIKSDLESARAQLQVARANLESARTNLNYAVIRSPIDGKVIERSVEAGQSVVSRMTTPTLFVIAADLSKMQIMADVDESDIGQIKVGQSVRFTVQAYPDETFQGSVRQIRLQPNTLQNVVNYTVVVDAANQNGKLLPGMTATVDFLIDQRKNVLLVPNAAIQFQPPERTDRGGFRPKQGPRPDGIADLPDGNSSGRPARVFVAGDNGGIRPVRFFAGLSNGVLTEISESRELIEGMQVVVGMEQKQKKNGTSGFRMRRRGPGGPPPF